MRIDEIDGELKRRRKDDKLAGYNSGKKKHLKQLAFHKCPKRIRWVFGGNRCGKTECGAVECVYMARGVHPYRENKKDTSGWVVSLSQQVQRDVAQKKILQYLRKDWIAEIVMISGRKDSPESGVIDFIKVKNVFGGLSTIGFKSCDQGREKFQGSSLDYVWFDEEPPRDIFDECRMRLIDRRGDMFATMTPLKGLTYVYDEIYMNRHGNKEIWYEFMEWSDNPFLDKEEISFLESSMSEEELLSRRNGKFSGDRGLVYPEFDESVHVIDPFTVPPEWQDMISIDPGLHNPLSVHWYAVDGDDNVYVVAEHYAAGKDIDFHAERIKEICSALDWHMGFSGKIEALIDSAATQRTLASQKSVADLFYERGISVNPKVNKDMFSGIARVKSYLSRKNSFPNIYIFSCCVNMIREIKGYFWSDGDLPIKRDDHSMDELRYYLMSKPRGVSERPIKSAVTLDKEKRMKRIKNDRFEGK